MNINTNKMLRTLSREEVIYIPHLNTTSTAINKNTTLIRTLHHYNTKYINKNTTSTATRC